MTATSHDHATRMLQPAGRRGRHIVPAAIAIAALCALPALADRDDGDARWTGTWSAAMQTPLAPAATFDHVTMREIVHVSIGGRVVRVRLSNAQGTQPLAIGAASVGVRASGASVRPGTLRTLSFAGSPTISIAPGGVALSDPVRLEVAAQSDLAISLYIPSPQPGTTQLTLAHQTSYVSTTGDFTAANDVPVGSTITTWYWLSGVEVQGGGRRAVVTFGDSITEGFASTTDANARWPDVLARRLQAQRRTADVAVLNEAISGNRVLNDVIGPNAQRRIDRDVLTQAGVGFVILLEGTNDMGFSQLPPGVFGPGVSLADVSAAEIIAGYEQIIARVHQAGARIYGATVLPFAGAGYYNAAVEPKRAALNEFIRTSGRFDGVIDFDAVMRDPAQPTRMRAEFDSGDHLHPNDAGYAAMGNAIDLRLFRDGDD
ncbi:MAG TPA: SGNH/GDSL hydrolase family protein [Kofleriaceae bacterium]